MAKQRRTPRIPKLPKSLWPTEAQEQMALVKWLKSKGIKHYAIWNGAHVGSVVQAVNMKRQGLSNGVPDLCLPIPKEPYHGLYIELKRVSGGTVSDAQKDWIEFLTEVGYKAIICKGCQEAIKEVEQYLC